jgi:cell wall-associated NlpC family hydrolase
MIKERWHLDPRRQRVLTEAEEWLRTPYHPMGRIKGVQGGTDCLMFLAEVYERAGIIDHVEVPYYRPDFMMHRGEERYLEGVLAHGHEVVSPEPGDVVLYKWGRVFAHAGIVFAWPRIMHAHVKYGVFWGKGDAAELAHDKAAKGPRRLKFISPF